MRDERRTVFEALVLEGLWVLIRCALGKNIWNQGIRFRVNAISYLDVHGVQTEDAKKYRRETAFPDA